MAKGKSTGERIPAKKRNAAVTAAVHGATVNQVATQSGLDWRTAKAIVVAESQTIAQRKEQLLDQALRISHKAALAVETDLPSATLMQAATIGGIYMDKAAALSGDPALIIRHEHLHAHAHEHRFTPITEDNYLEILDALPDADAVSDKPD